MQPAPPSSQPTSPTAPLDEERLRRQLAGSAIGHTVQVYASLPSTMPVAANLIRRPEVRSGVVVVAEEQTAGRGRHSRSWFAPARTALLVSIALKPPHLRLSASYLPIAAGLAVLDAVSACVPELSEQFSLKWPNDLLLGPAPAEAGKVAGILIETVLDAQGHLAYAVIGCGINANQTADELPQVAPPAPPPMSLRLARGAPVDRTDLLIHLCRALGPWLATPADGLLAAWRARLSTLGQPIAVYEQGQTTPLLTGLAVDVDASAVLVVQDAEGVRHAIHAGEVSLRPFDG
ncbi:MAG TPA: biotin--[acetyl-CoA-carboxylase] ligase [Caldilineaceae bacterium]|nr:biotin--[acetyl-CoA-carboxylase] ligase [Caldilineaceae bacterium]